jgi:hypothetical protein
MTCTKAALEEKRANAEEKRAMAELMPRITRQ